MSVSIFVFSFIFAFVFLRLIFREAARTSGVCLLRSLSQRKIYLYLYQKNIFVFVSVSIFEFVFVFLRLSFGKLHTLLASVCSALSHKERLLAVDLAHPRIHMDFLVFVLVFSCPGSSIPDLGQSVTATLEFRHKE